MKYRLRLKDIFLGQLIPSALPLSLPLPYEQALVALGRTWYARQQEDGFYRAPASIIELLSASHDNDAKISTAVMEPRSLADDCNVRYIKYTRLLMTLLQFRGEGLDLGSLVADIADQDIQVPITVQRTGDYYMVKEGLRRARACMTLALTYGPAQPWWAFVPCRQEGGTNASL